MKKIIFFGIAIMAALIILSSKTVLSDPSLNQTNMTAEGGNVTLLGINGDQQSVIWQGYFGSVSGGLVLANSDGDSFYDWSAVAPSGEIMASREIITDWSDINCTNQTELYEEEFRLDITNSSSDGINDTFKNNTHPVFDIGYTTLNGCRSTLTDNSTTNNAVFWNVLLNSDENTTVYVAIIDNNQVGFNGSVVDYQLLVPTNWSTGVAQYNLYIDIT